MADFYRIGVRITMVDGVSAVLAALGHELLGLDRKLELTKDNVGRLKQAIIALGELTLGTALLKGFGRLAEAGDKSVGQMAWMQVLSESVASIAPKMQATYQAAAATMHGATAAAAALEYATVLRGQSPGMTEKQADRTMIAGLKGIDVCRAFANRQIGQLYPKKAEEAFHTMEVASVLTNGMLNGQGFCKFVQMAGPAVSVKRLREYPEQTVEVMLGCGRTGGRSMQMAFTKLLGGNLTKAQAEELVAVGAVRQSDIRKEFGRYTLRPGALAGYSDLATKGVDYWLQQELLPLLQKAEHGKGMAGLIVTLNKSGAMDKKTTDLVSRVTNTGAMPVAAERLLAFLLMNQAQVDRFKDQFDKALKTDAAGVLEAKSWTMKMQTLQSARQGLMQATSGAEPRLAIPFIQDIAMALKALTGAVGAHPEAPKTLVALIGTIATMLTIAGGARAAVTVMRTMTRALPALGQAFGGFASGSEAAGGLALLTTGLPELAAAMLGPSRAAPVLQHSLDTFIGEGVLGRSPKHKAEFDAHRKEMLRKRREWGEKHVWRHLDPFNWDLRWPELSDLKVPGQLLIAPDQPPAWVARIKKARAAGGDSGQTTNVTIDAPLNVRIDGSLLGADYATLNFYMQGWIKRHGREIGNALHQVQKHNQRQSFLDRGGAEAASA
ncbi:MAG: hypothetical protein ACREFP_04110 [Acetobacteraceae bacterium]